MSTLYVLVGLPGSGKSTWIKDFAKTSTKEFYVASTDDIIELIASEQKKTYADVWQSNIDHATKKMNNDVIQAIKAKKDVIWDQTNMTAGKRQSILSKFPKEYHKIAVVFSVENEELNARLHKRHLETGKFIPPHVITNMQKTYQEPTEKEGFNVIIHV